jgi:hypothetical protein
MKAFSLVKRQLATEDLQHLAYKNEASIGEEKESRMTIRQLQGPRKMSIF